MVLPRLIRRLPKPIRKLFYKKIENMGKFRRIGNYKPTNNDVAKFQHLKTMLLKDKLNWKLGGLEEEPVEKITLIVDKYGLTGYYTGMIISEYQEARFCNVEATQDDIDKSNELFGNALTESIDKKDIKYKTIIQDNFEGIYYPVDENKTLDIVIQNIYQNLSRNRKYF